MDICPTSAKTSERLNVNPFLIFNLNKHIFPAYRLFRFYLNPKADYRLLNLINLSPALQALNALK